MPSAKQKNTEPESPSQPQNGYGRVPEKQVEQVSRLTHLQAHVYLVCCMVANRKRDPVGEVPLSVRKLAQLANSSHPRVLESLSSLQEAGLIRYESGTIHLTHYIVPDQMVPSENHTGSLKEPPRLHERTTPVLSENHSSSQPTEPTLFPVPRNVSNDSNGSKGAKRKRSAPPPKVIWDEEKMQLRALDEKWRDEFQERWIATLGEEVFAYQLRRLNAWLAKSENVHKRSGPNIRLDRRMENWMMNEVK